MLMDTKLEYLMKEYLMKEYLTYFCGVDCDCGELSSLAWRDSKRDLSSDSLGTSTFPSSSPKVGKTLDLIQDCTCITQAKEIRT